MSPRLVSIVSSVVAAAVPVADAAFGWHLQSAVVLGIVLPLIGLAFAEVGHAHVGKGTVLADVEKALAALPAALAEFGKAKAAS